MVPKTIEEFAKIHDKTVETVKRELSTTLIC